jgi:2-dehydropantoate 2-reductase
MLETPDWLFRNVGLRLQKIDASARSSMADDLAKGRKTEIEFLNGEVVALAERHGLQAPVNARIVELIKAAEAEGSRPASAESLAIAVLG